MGGIFPKAGDDYCLFSQNLFNSSLEGFSEASQLECTNGAVQMVHVDEILEAEPQTSTVAEIGDDNVQENSLVSLAIGAVPILIEPLGSFNNSDFHRGVGNLLQKLSNSVKGKTQAFGTVRLVEQKIHERSNKKFQSGDIGHLKEVVPEVNSS